jgi:hypothetical protein
MAPFSQFPDRGNHRAGRLTRKEVSNPGKDAPLVKCGKAHFLTF